MNLDKEVARQAYGVVERYFAALNEGDSGGVKDALNFPHFRIGATGTVIYYPDDSGDPLANFPAKAHVGINFRRLRADGSEIGAYYSLYIITEIDGHWGIQGGSGNGT